MFSARSHHARTPTHEAALDCLEAGIEAAHPSVVVPEQVHYDPGSERLTVADGTYDLHSVENVYVVGGGNAAGAIALALESALGDRIEAGAVVTDEPRETTTIETLPGDHPIPSERGVEHTAEMCDLAARAGSDDLVLAVVGGGGSALMTAPVEAVSLDALRGLTDELLRSGATIDEINAVRKHLSTLKGGRLAQLVAPAATVALVFSDVVGDDPSVVASGPTAPDSTTFETALTALERYDVTVPASVRSYLERGVEGAVPETPGPDSAVFDRVHTHILASGETAVGATAQRASARGYTPLVLSTRMRGEARESALAHVAIAEECLAAGQPVEPPAVLLSGGETTVTVRGDGTGGPNQEFALSAGRQLPEGVVLGSVDTDGLDGSTDAAGALVDATTVADSDAAAAALEANDAYPFLDDRRALLRTGATGTSVNDLRVIAIEA